MFPLSIFRLSDPVESSWTTSRPGTLRISGRGSLLSLELLSDRTLQLSLLKLSDLLLSISDLGLRVWVFGKFDEPLLSSGVGDGVADRSEGSFLPVGNEEAVI